MRITIKAALLISTTFISSLAVADGFSSLQSDALSPLFSNNIDDIFAKSTHFNTELLPVVEVSESPINNKRYSLEYFPTFSCGTYLISNLKPIKIAYTVTFQQSNDVWVPLNGKVHSQSFWQVNIEPERYAWIKDTK